MPPEVTFRLPNPAKSPSLDVYLTYSIPTYPHDTGTIRPKRNVTDDPCMLNSAVHDTLTCDHASFRSIITLMRPTLSLI